MVQKQDPNTGGTTNTEISMVVISGRLESARDHSEVPSRSSSSLKSTRDYTEVLSRSNCRVEDKRVQQKTRSQTWSLVGGTDLLDICWQAKSLLIKIMRIWFLVFASLFITEISLFSRKEYENTKCLYKSITK
jgi:hypothetical protein